MISQKQDYFGIPATLNNEQQQIKWHFLPSVNETACSHVEPWPFFTKNNINNNNSLAAWMCFNTSSKWNPLEMKILSLIQYIFKLSKAQQPVCCQSKQ